MGALADGTPSPASTANEYKYIVVFEETRADGTPLVRRANQAYASSERRSIAITCKIDSEEKFDSLKKFFPKSGVGLSL